jgi:hypothetical protein
MVSNPSVGGVAAAAGGVAGAAAGAATSAADGAGAGATSAFSTDASTDFTGGDSVFFSAGDVVAGDPPPVFFLFLFFLFPIADRAASSGNVLSAALVCARGGEWSSLARVFSIDVGRFDILAPHSTGK